MFTACRGHVAAEQTTAIPTFAFLSVGTIVDAVTNESSEPATTLQHLDSLEACTGKMSLVVGIMSHTNDATRFHRKCNEV